MRNLYFLFAVLFFVNGKAQIINFPDANVKARLLQTGANSYIAQGQSGDNIQIDTNNDNEIDVVEAQAVYRLNLQDGGIYDLDGLNYFVNLRVLQAAYNYFSSCDVSALQYLYAVDVAYNPNLLSLNIKNGVLGFSIPQPPPIPNGIGNANFTNCPNLNYVCCDEDKIEEGNQYLMDYGLTNITINDYCNFSPGGTYYTFSGHSKLDADVNGCDDSDTNYPFLKLSINNGTLSSNYFTSLTGNYSLSLPTGSYTIAPQLENSNYFQVNPASVVLQFPQDPSPFIQNFCVTPNGIHPDLEVTLLPITVARPGFDATYKIVYKNVGNTVQSGTIELLYNQEICAFLTATPTFLGQTPNHLFWNFSGLNPFETRTIIFTVNVNSATETPPVTINSILGYSVYITGNENDETPENNSSQLMQSVVGSFDPNDKICLEGPSLAPEQVGKYVHYMIRFENTGTANAENIVVKDIIDTEKFDINSLVPIDGSHPFVTKMSNTNKVEFIFENINLPFDDANNDGYLVFKIKTKSTLVTFDSFSNSASIYFDFNAPIYTNSAVTTVAPQLASADFIFEDYFKIYPNPAKDILNIETKKAIAVTSITIYNTLGQVVLVIPNARQTKSVDVSSLKAGNYLMKVNSEKGNSIVKFVKI